MAHAVVVRTPDEKVIINAGGLPGPLGPLGPPGPQGVPGQDAKWVRMTQAEYDALFVRDPLTLYVIIG